MANGAKTHYTFDGLEFKLQLARRSTQSNLVQNRSR